MYIDEVGDPGLHSLDDERHRYLSLTGVIIDLDHVSEFVHPQLESLKQQFFGNHHHPDSPIVLHRKELVNGVRPFESLRNDELREKFNATLLDFLLTADYRVATVVIDKVEHVERYRTWRFDPYHYCLAVLAERYVLWFDRRGQQGDVMAESRGGKEDMRLKKSFNLLFNTGTDYVGADKIQRTLSSSQLKVKKKDNNIAGLQLADLLAHPSFKNTLTKSSKSNTTVSNAFGAKIADILESKKYLRNASGKTLGWGAKILP